MIANPPALARRRPLRGRVHLRPWMPTASCTSPTTAAPTPGSPRCRRYATVPEVAVPRLVALYREFDMRQTFFPAGVVHRTLPPSGGVDPERRPRDSPTTTTCTSTPTRCRPRRGAVLVRAQHGRDREGHRPAPGRLPRRHLPVLAPHPRTSSSTTGSSTMHPCSATTSPTCSRTAAARSSSCPATTASTTGRIYQFSRDFLTMMPVKSAAQAHGVFREEFDAGLGVRGALGVGVASVPERTPCPGPCGEDPHRIHARQGPGLVRDPGRDREPRPNADRHRGPWTPRIESAAVLSGSHPRARRGRAARRRALTSCPRAAPLLHDRDAGRIREGTKAPPSGRRSRVSRPGRSVRARRQAARDRYTPAAFPPPVAMSASTDIPLPAGDAKRIGAVLESLPHNAKLGIRMVEIAPGTLHHVHRVPPRAGRRPEPEGAARRSGHHPDRRDRGRRGVHLHPRGDVARHPRHAHRLPEAGGAPDQRLYASAELYRLTRRIAFVRASAYQDDPGNQVAHCAASFMIGSLGLSMRAPDVRARPRRAPARRAGRLLFRPSTASLPYAGFIHLDVEIRGRAGRSRSCARTPARRQSRHADDPRRRGGSAAGARRAHAALLRAGARARSPAGKSSTSRSTTSAHGLLEDTFARGVIIRQGRRVANVRVDAWQSDPGKLVAGRPCPLPASGE